MHIHICTMAMLYIEVLMTTRELLELEIFKTRLEMLTSRVEQLVTRLEKLARNSKIFCI